jgi:ClpP class serine protease
MFPFCQITQLELGLIDGIGDIHSVLEEKFGANVQIVPVKQRRNIMQAFSENIATTAFTQVEDRLMSSRFF